jgi:glycosyltransferase involved in cell wall biosynthesis
MRVVLVTHYYPAHGGGIERVAGEIARRLAGEGMELEWHASDCDPAPDDLRCVPAATGNFTEAWLGFPYPLWSPAALARLRSAVRAADVVHLHDCLYFGNQAAFSAARGAGKPVLLTQHVGAVPYRSGALRLLQAAAYRVLGRRVLEGACRVAFISEATRAHFQDRVRFRQAPVTIPNGVDGSLFQPADEARRRTLRHELGIPDGKPLLLFAGRFVEKKGLPLLSRLVPRLADAQWLFAGAGPLDPARWGAPNVRVMRGLDQARLAPLYQAADLLVLPSVGEGFPLVVQEAMASGTPALVSPETARGLEIPAALLASEPLGASGDAVAQWEARIRALVPPAEAQRCALADFARQHWSWENCARRHVELLRGCVAR